MFSKSTEVWFKGALLYADYEFDAQFFELFAIHKFLRGANFIPKSVFLHIDWNFP